MTTTLIVSSLRILICVPFLLLFVIFEVDAHRKWVRNCHVGLACQMKMVVARSNVVKAGNPQGVGYGDSFILSPQGEMLARAELFRTELLTAKIKEEHFRHPVVWADLDDTPQNLKKILSRLLLAQKSP